jgi:hypothetical protein
MLNEFIKWHLIGCFISSCLTDEQNAAADRVLRPILGFLLVVVSLLILACLGFLGYFVFSFYSGD